jgi:hypothetical protein
MADKVYGGTTDLQTQIDQIIVNTNEKMLAVMRDAINETVQDMQVTIYNGGKMRVDTGFLRASGAARLGGLPVGASENPGKISHNWDGANLELTLGQMQLGDAFYWGWTAKYAKYREVYDGFMESALQNWQNRINSSVAKINKMFS